MNRFKNTSGVSAAVWSISLLLFTGCDFIPIDPVGFPHEDPQETETEEAQESDTNDTASSSCDVGDLSGVCANITPGAAIAVTDNNNYAYQHDFQINHEVVKGNTNLSIDWSALTRDFVGREIDPTADVDIVMVTLWSLGRTELIDQIVNDDLDVSSNMGAIWMYPDGSTTQTDLFSLGSAGEPVPEEDLLSYFDSDSVDYDPTQYTHLLLAQRGTTIGKDVLMMKTFTLDSNTSDTALSLDAASTVLSYSVDLRSLRRVGVPAEEAQITIDWMGLTTNMMGNPFIPTKITRVTVAHFEDMTVCDMESAFIHLEEMADELYSNDLTAVSGGVNLGSLTSTGGKPFSGIDGNGTWILALECDACHSTAPQFLTVLEPCD
jgi:hypothetical protein